MPSTLFKKSPRQSKGRRATRHLDDTRVYRAMVKTTDLRHQMKFMSKSQKEAAAKFLTSVPK